LVVGSFLLSLILTAAVRKWALRIGFVSKPRQDRFGQRAVPLGGGVAIFASLSFIILSAVLALRLSFFQQYISRYLDLVDVKSADFFAKFNQLVLVLACSFILFILGLWDDKKHLGPFLKLTVQFAVAVIAAAFADVRVEFFIQSKIVTTLLSAFWIVSIVNVFNFLDNMDGACAGIAVIVSSVLFTAAALSGQVFVGGLSLVFIGILLGFLVFNFPPAKIFAGDAGSLVIGFFVALISLRTTYYQQAESGKWFAVFMPLIALAVPLYDFASVTFLRIRQGKSPFVGDTQHFSHRLNRRGLSPTQTVLTLYLATLCTGLGATFLYQVNAIGVILIFCETIMILSIIAVFESTGNNTHNPP
jgi:UDP-GlcNAc:undecaprenyl-phosphate/decaprenyl-phosphate GlcNAc-1-phosphate transferase